MRSVKRLTSLYEQDFPSPWSSWDSCVKLGSPNWKKDAVGCSNNVVFWVSTCREVVTPADSSFDPSVHLTAAYVSVDSHSSPSYLAVRIKALKIDPFRQGMTIYLGRTNYRICPVVAGLSYLVRRGWTPGPLFTFVDGWYLTRDRFIKAVRDAIAASGVDASKYAGHSFRIGAMTTAASSGIQDSLIRTMGR